MRKRSVWIEPLFGEAKQWHGLRQFRLRGLDKVNIQAQLVASGQNLKRWLGHQGWGRWFTPDGSPSVAYFHQPHLPFVWALIRLAVRKQAANRFSTGHHVPAGHHRG